MESLTPLLGRRLNVPLAWLATLVLGATAAGFALAGESHWALLAALIAAASVVPPTLARDPGVTFPGGLLVLVAVPAVVRLTGLFEGATPFLAVAGLALLVAVLLDGYTSLDVTPRFAVVFVVVTTLAFAGAWTVAAWLADRFLGTGFISGQQALMWDLVVAAAAGVAGGLVVQQYLSRTDRDDEGVPGEHGEPGAPADDAPVADTEPVAEDAADPADDEPAVDGDDGPSRAARLGVRAMQVGLLGILALGAWRGNWGLIVNSSIPLAVTLLPTVLRREYGYSMHAGLALWLTLAVFLHAVGALGPYRQYGWYDSVTHAISGTLAAGVGYAVARAAELHTDHVSFDPRFRATFVVLFVLATAVCWELLEFATGQLAAATGGNAALAQYGVDDIALDVVYSGVGGLVVAAWGSGYFERPARATVDSLGGLVGRD